MTTTGHILACAVWLVGFLLLGLIAVSPAWAGPRIVVLATGGTIASSETTTARTGAQLLSQLHLDGTMQIEVKDVAQGGSSDLTREDWAHLITAIRTAFADPAISGVVVTHGTDTMEETAFFLDLVIDDPRPVVVTGSMRASDALSADGPGNLAEAIRVAADPEARNLGTLVVLDDQILSAVTATKTDTNRLSAFRTINTGPIGIFSEGVPHLLARPFTQHRHWMLTSGEIATLPRVETVVAQFDVDDMLLRAAEAAGARAIVIAGFGSGTVTTPMRRFIAASGAHVPIILSSRVGAGLVKDAYDGESDAGPLMIVRGGSLNPAKARVLAMVALAAHTPIDQALFDGF